MIHSESFQDLQSIKAMQEITLDLTLYGEEYLKEGQDWSRIRCEHIGPTGSELYHVIREPRGFMFLNPAQGGFNGYHPTLKDLVINALLRAKTRVFVV